MPRETVGGQVQKALDEKEQSGAKEERQPSGWTTTLKALIVTGIRSTTCRYVVLWIILSTLATAMLAKMEGSISFLIWEVPSAVWVGGLASGLAGILLATHPRLQAGIDKALVAFSEGWRNPDK